MLKGDFEVITGKICFAGIGLMPQGRLAVMVSVNTKDRGGLYFKCVTDNAHSVIESLLRITEEPDFNNLTQKEIIVFGRHTFGAQGLCAIGNYADRIDGNDYSRAWLLEDGTVEYEDGFDPNDPDLLSKIKERAADADERLRARIDGIRRQLQRTLASKRQ
jgi:hypothetical protein